MHLVTPAPGTFTNQELERLAVYRAAVAAGFYTDDVPGTPSEAPEPDNDEEGHQPADGVPTDAVPGVDVPVEDVPTDTATSEPPAR
jgi:hypothetical protein